MGMMAKRSAFGVLVLAAVLLPFRHHDAPNSGSPARASVDHADSTAALLRQLEFRWVASDARDVAMAAAPAASNPPPISLAGFDGAELDAQSRGLVASIWGRIGPVVPSTRVAITAYDENGENYGVERYAGAVVEFERGGATCRAVLPAFRGDSGVHLSSFYTDAAIGPCALLAAFGPPGPAVRAWLERTRFAAAQSNDWLARPADYLPRRGPWSRVAMMDYNHAGSAIWRVARAVRLEDVAALVSPPYSFGPTALQCLDGNAAACRLTVVAPRLVQQADGALSPDLTYQARYIPFDSTFAAIPPVNGTYLSNLISEFGRERFRRFWISSLPFDGAFERAFGLPVGAWTSRWASRLWAASFEAHERSDAVLLGASMSAPAVIGAAVWTAVALLLAMVVVQRRVG